MPKRIPRHSFVGASAPSVSLKAGYDSRWRTLRNARIIAEPLCRHCSANGLVTPAQEVDHIQPKALGGKDEWANTQSLCKPCHQEKTRQDIKRINGGF